MYNRCTSTRLTMSQFPKVRDITATLLEQAGIRFPPIQVREVAGFLGYEVESDPKYPQLSGHEMVSGTWRIIVRPPVRPERESFAIAHEMAHIHWMDEIHHNGDPSLGGKLEYFCNKFASLLIVPYYWFKDDARETGYDLFELKKIYTTASHELLANRLAGLRQTVVTIFDDDGNEKRVTRRFTASGNAPVKLSKAETQIIKDVCWSGSVIEKTGTVREDGRFERVKLKAYPVFEGEWKRVIVFMEPADQVECEAEEFMDDIYPFPEY